MERAQVKDMVSAMVADSLKDILRTQSEMRERLIGIDGNGTGREGALQRQDKKIAEIAETIGAVREDVGEVKMQIAEFTRGKQVWTRYKKTVAGAAGAVAVVALELLGKWIAHRMGI